MVNKSKDINQLADHITKIVEDIKVQMEADCRTWQNSSDVKQIQSMGTTRGRQRFIKTNS